MIVLVRHKESRHGAKPLCPARLDVQSQLFSVPALEDAMPLRCQALLSTRPSHCRRIARLRAGSRKLDQNRHLPTRNERKWIFGKNMHQKRNIDSGCFRRGKCLMPIHVRRNQSVAIHNDPLVRISGAILLDPVHFAPSITGRDHSDDRFLLKFDRKSLEAHTSTFLMIPEIAASRGRR